MPASKSRQGHPVELIYRDLRIVLRQGIRVASLVAFPQLLELAEPTERLADEDVYGQAIALDRMLRTALTELGEGPEGRAARLLFGVDAEGRGRPLKDRRRLAAREFDVLPSTFRRNYEDDIVEDLAVGVLVLTRRPVPREEA